MESNNLNSKLIERDLRRNRKREVYLEYGGYGSLARENVSCVGFMNTSPDLRMKFAQESGLYPAEIQYYD